MTTDSSARRWSLAPPGGLSGKLPGEASLRAFLQAAVSLETVDAQALQERGVARWDVDRYLKQLRGSGELREGTWDPAAREAYRALLGASPAPVEGAAVDPTSVATVRSSPFVGGEGPRERALRLGIDALGDDELLALLLRTGTASLDVMQLSRDLLARYDGLVGLAGMDVVNLARAHGLGQAKAAEIAAAFELARRLARAARRERPKLITPESVAAILSADLACLGHEEFWCLPLDPRSRLLGEPRVLSRGDIDGTEAGPRLFYRHALLAGAASVIAVHNHPTGDPSPSAADMQVTKRLVSAGRTVDCPLVDHIIIGDGGRFCSLRRDHGQLFA